MAVHVSQYFEQISMVAVATTPLDFEVVYQASIKHHAPDALSRLKTERTDNSNLDEKLLVLMNDETEEHDEAKTEYFDKVQPGKEQVGNNMDSNREETQPPTLRELLNALENNRACT